MGKIADFIKGIIDGITSKQLVSRLSVFLFVLQSVLFMRKIADFIKRIIKDITSKQLIFGFGGLLAMFFVMLLLVMLFDGTAQNVGYLLGTMSKTETIQLIGWAMSGALVIIGIVVANRWIDAQVRAAEKRIADSGKGSVDDIIGKWIMSIFTVFFIGLLVVLLVVLVSVMLSNDVTESVGNLLGIQCDKIKIIKFIGWAMGGVSAVAGITVLILRTDVQMHAVEGEITDSQEGTTIDSVIRKWLMFIFTVLFITSFIALLVVLVWVILPGSAAEQVGRLLGIENKDKTHIIEFIGLAISGTLVAIGLVFLSQRTDAQIRTAEAQVENNRLVEKGHRQERFKAATKHLGHKSASVRIAALYEFVHLIKDNGGEYRKRISDILYAHMRNMIDWFTNCDDVKEAKEKNKPIKFTQEIQGLLDILFKSQDIDRSDINPHLQGIYFSRANLASADLSEANLSGANLSEADLSGVNLSGANLSKADLPKAKLSEADLSGAKLFKADLFGADLSGADLSGADLSGADLHEANLSKTDLSGAKLFGANLSKADLFGANFSIADLSRADLSGANLFSADLSGANLFSAKLFGANLLRANLSQANLSQANLSDTELARANLHEANLSEAKLFRANLLKANLFRADLFGADLRRANFLGANLSGANLSEIDLFGVDFSHANLSGANLSGANLSGANLSETKFFRADLSKVQLGGASYTNKTRFPEWFVLPMAPPDNGDKVQFPKGFVAPEKPKSDE